MASSPVPKTVENILQTILTKISGLENSVSTLGRENNNRMTEIAKLGRELGFQSKIETNKEPEYTSDNDYDDDIPESKQSNHARRVTCQARENPKYTEGQFSEKVNCSEKIFCSEFGKTR